ncbi:site-specific integrase [Falsiroseomonas ponticola]|uniref:site-specific integrase n=1 Tax=Falsiroseomonas ponticola TaxID=2786951 RepID=UPI0019341C21|nr:site-specific integrase [Roseomonas ponticola]
MATQKSVDQLLSSNYNTPTAMAAIPALPTFAAVRESVQAAPDLTEGARKNLLRAVDIVAGQMGAAGISAPVDISRIRRLFEKLTPAMIGYSSPGGLSSMKSSFHRALRIAGLTVMPGKSRTSLSSAWGILREAAEPSGSWPAVSRFAHWCSENGVEPAYVEQGHVARFVALVGQTSLKQRADKAERQVVRAWRIAQAKVPGWPVQPLPMPHPKKGEASPAWSVYPPSLEAEAKAFVARGAEADGDWLAQTPRTPLRPATREAYLGTLRRAAGELVASGIPPEDISSLTDLVRPDRVKRILTGIRNRTHRSKGSSVSQTAIVLTLVAREYPDLLQQDVKLLMQMERAVRAGRGMGNRTVRKLEEIDDPAKRRALLNLPGKLMREVKARATVDISSARLVRAALFLQLLVDTGSRQGNIVCLDLERHVCRLRDGSMWIFIEGAETKNGVELEAPLPPETAAMLDTYVREYRPLHSGQSTSSWLFARSDGSHWPRTEANQTLQDITAKYIGVPVNPHLVRAVIAEILEEAAPGALGLARDVLGHRSIQTTEAHYARRKAARSRRLHQETMDRVRRGR